MSQTCCPVIRRCCPRLIPLVITNPCVCPVALLCSGSGSLLPLTQSVTEGTTTIIFSPGTTSGTFDIITDGSGNPIGFRNLNSIPSNISVNLTGSLTTTCDGGFANIQLLRNGVPSPDSIGFPLSPGTASFFTIQTFTAVPFNTTFTSQITITGAPTGCSIQLIDTTLTISCA